MATLFDYLGVPVSASASFIEEAFLDAVVRHGGPDRLPIQVERAYTLLRHHGFRENYQAVLAACATASRVSIRPEDRATFLGVCREGGVSVEEDAGRAGVFRVTLQK